MHFTLLIILGHENKECLSLLFVQGEARLFFSGRSILILRGGQNILEFIWLITFVLFTNRKVFDQKN